MIIAKVVALEIHVEIQVTERMNWIQERERQGERKTY